MLRRHGTLGPDAAPHSAEIGAADFAAGLRAIHRRSSPQGYGSPIRPVAGADWRIAPRVDSSRATHGGEYREAAVARKNCQVHGPVAPPNRALIQAGFELRPKRYYLEMRLRRARELLLQTAMPIMDITTACGFQSPPHFSKCYRSQFGYPPSEERTIGGRSAAGRSNGPAAAAV